MQCVRLQGSNSCTRCLKSREKCVLRSVTRRRFTDSAVTAKRPRIRATEAVFSPGDSPYAPRPIPWPIETPTSPEVDHVLRYIYSDQMRYDHEGVTSVQFLDALFKQFIRCYGPRISNVALRYAVSAYIGAYSHRDFISYYDKLEYAQHAYVALRTQIQSPQVDEGTLFASAILTLWSVRLRDSAYKTFCTLRKGTLQIMSYLIKREGGDRNLYPLSDFWPMIKTEIFAHGLEFNCETADDANGLYIDECRQLLGLETRRQCREYGKRLGLDEKVLYMHESIVTMQHFNILMRCIDEAKMGRNFILVAGRETRLVLLDIYNDIRSSPYRSETDRFSNTRQTSMCTKFVLETLGGGIEFERHGINSHLEVCRSLSAASLLLIKEASRAVHLASRNW